MSGFFLGLEQMEYGLEQAKPSEINNLTLYRRAKALSSLAKAMGHTDQVVTQAQNVYQTLLNFERSSADSNKRSVHASKGQSNI